VEEYGDEDTPEGADPTISLHALTGIQPRSGHTMQIYVLINATKLRALLDSRSTHNFVESEAVSWAGIAFMARGNLRITVANGDRVASFGCCRNLTISIAGELFVIDYYELALGSYAMVLGVQLLPPLRPILWDFRTQSMLFVRNGRTIKPGCGILHRRRPRGAPSALHGFVHRAHSLATRAHVKPLDLASSGYVASHCQAILLCTPSEARVGVPVCRDAHARGHPPELIGVRGPNPPHQEVRRLMMVLLRLPGIECQDRL
jgi:hypothetical protein